MDLISTERSYKIQYKVTHLTLCFTKQGRVTFGYEIISPKSLRDSTRPYREATIAIEDLPDKLFRELRGLGLQTVAKHLELREPQD